MATMDRWDQDLMMLQESVVWLVPDEALARMLVEEAGLPTQFIDFSEPVYLRIRRILLEATKRGMMVQLLDTLTGWYEGNEELKTAIAAWHAGEDRRAAAAALMKAARKVKDPIATAVVTRVADKVEKVEVEVVIPDHVETEAAPVADKPPVAKPIGQPAPKAIDKPSPVKTDAERVEIFEDELQPGDWFSIVRTVSDQERRIRELEAWRQKLSISPTTFKASQASDESRPVSPS